MPTPLHQIADKYVSRFADTFERSAEKLPAKVTLEVIEADLARSVKSHPKSLYALIDEMTIAKEAPATEAEKVYRDLILSVASANGVVMDLNSPFMLDAAKTLTADLITNVNAETKAAIRQMIFEAIRDGDAPLVAQKQIREIVGLTKRDAVRVKRVAATHPERVPRLRAKLVRRRAITIARSETMRASNIGQKATWRQMMADGVLDPARFKSRWITTPDDRLCSSCAPMEGQTVAIDENFESTERGVLPSERVPYEGDTVETPPLHPSCVVEGTLVRTDCLERVYRRLYVGPVLEIRLATGEVCTVTPNHPVLTDAGWKAACVLDEGDRLVYCGLGEQQADPIYPDVEGGPTEVGELYNAAAVSGLKDRIGGADHQFHGDGFDGEVDVVTVNRQLRDGIEAASAKHGFKQCLASPDDALVLAPVGGGLDEGSIGVARGGESGAFFGGSAIHADVHSFAPVAGFDAIGEQPFSDDVPTDVEIVSDGLLGFPGLVAPDDLRVVERVDGGLLPSRAPGLAAVPQRDARLTEAPGDDAIGDGKALCERVLRLASEVSLSDVIAVKHLVFHGFVFNLQTANGWYWSNGIVSHNCRCTIAADFGD